MHIFGMAYARVESSKEEYMRRYLIGLVSTFVLLVALWYRFTPLTAFFWGALLIGPVLFIPARWWAVLGLAGLAAEPIVGFVKGEDAVEQLAKIIFLCFS